MNMRAAAGTAFFSDRLVEGWTVDHFRATGDPIDGDPVRQMDVYQRWIDWLVPYLK